MSDAHSTTRTSSTPTRFERTQLARRFKQVFAELLIAEHDLTPDRSIVLLEGHVARSDATSSEPVTIGLRDATLAGEFDMRTAQATYREFAAAIVSHAPDAYERAQAVYDQLDRRLTAWRHGPLSAWCRAHEHATYVQAHSAPWVDERPGRPPTTGCDAVEELRERLTSQAAQLGADLDALVAGVGPGRATDDRLVQLAREAVQGGASREAVARALRVSVGSVRRWCREMRSEVAQD